MAPSAACTPCQESSVTLDAVAYCRPCQMFLCQACLRAHAAFAATKCHKIVKGVALQSMVKCQQSSALVSASIPQYVPTNLKESQLTKVDDYNVRDSTEVNTCCITGAAYLQDGRLVLCDYHNNSVKLLDEHHKLHCTVVLEDYPHDVAVAGSRELVATVPHGKCLQFLSVTDNSGLELGRHLAVGTCCYGVIVREKLLYVTCYDWVGGAGEVVTMDLEGEKRMRVGGAMFSRPFYIAVAMTGEIIVSDWKAGTVTTLDNTGKKLNSCTDPELQSPHGMLVDTDGSILVCGGESDNLQAITNDGVKVTDVLTMSDGLKKPYTVSYRARDGLLVVGMYGSDVISVYRSDVAPPGAGTVAKDTTPSSPTVVCPICLESDKEIKQGGNHLKATKCGHVFCSICIDEVMKSNKRCPVCRKHLAKDQIHTLHL